MSLKGIIYSSPIWLTGVWYFHEKYYPVYWSWIGWGCGSLFLLWLVGKIFIARRNRRRERERLEQAWGKRARNIPHPIQQAPVIYQMPYQMAAPQMQQQFPTWVDLPEERYEI